MYSRGTVAWWTQSKPVPWPVKVISNTCNSTKWRCSLFGVECDHKEIDEAFLAPFETSLHEFEATDLRVQVQAIKEARHFLSQKNSFEQSSPTDKYDEANGLVLKKHLEAMHAVEERIARQLQENTLLAEHLDNTNKKLSEYIDTLQNLKRSFENGINNFLDERMHVFKETVSNM